MLDLSTRPTNAIGPDSPTGPSRQLRRTRRLPAGRAVVGGFLVASASLGVFALSGAGGSGPASSFVVVAPGASVIAGQVIEAGDVGLVPLDLPPS